MSAAAVRSSARRPHCPTCERLVAARAADRRFLGDGRARSSRSSLLGGRQRARRSGRPRLLAAHEKWVALVVLARRRSAIDVIYFIPRASLIPREVPHPGNDLPDRVPGRPDHLQRQRRLHELLDGAHPRQERGDRSGSSVKSLRSRRTGRRTRWRRPATPDGKLVLLLVDEADAQAVLGTPEGLSRSPALGRHRRGRRDQRRDRLQDREGRRRCSRWTRSSRATRVPLRRRGDPSRGLRVRGRAAARRKRYDPIDRHVHRARTGRSSTATTAAARSRPTSGKELEPGWKTYNGFEQFSKIVTDPLYPRPFLRVLLWTFVFATSTVIFSFALGLFLAITLENEASVQRVYRSLLIIPFAVPAFLTMLVWAGLLNHDFGVVNKILPAEHRLALRSVVGEGLGDPRQRLADVPVLLPRLAGRAAVDPGRARRGGEGGRRRRLAGLPADHPAAAAHRRSRRC